MMGIYTMTGNRTEIFCSNCHGGCGDGEGNPCLFCDGTGENPESCEKTIAALRAELAATEAEGSRLIDSQMERAEAAEKALAEVERQWDALIEEVNVALDIYGFWKNGIKSTPEEIHQVFLKLKSLSSAHIAAVRNR